MGCVALLLAQARGELALARSGRGRPALPPSFFPPLLFDALLDNDLLPVLVLLILHDALSCTGSPSGEVAAWLAVRQRVDPDLPASGEESASSAAVAASPTRDG
ncbi:MAG: hypothetical protein U5R31_04660 [Acidimicrobiia bacterium]|nr:hypothetical protein [Acidimicrobiia bacterium]